MAKEKFDRSKPHVNIGTIGHLRKITDTNDRATIRRTLHYFWWVTKQRPGAFALSIISSVGYIALLTFANTYVMGRTTQIGRASCRERV